MVRADGTAGQHHLGFIWRLAAFYVIAPNARADQIFPRILATTAFRHDVIDSERNARRAAILAAVTIPPQNILPRKDHLLEWHPNIRG